MTIDNASKTWKKLSKIKASGTLNQKAIVMFPRIQVIMNLGGMYGRKRRFLTRMGMSDPDVKSSKKGKSMRRISSSQRKKNLRPMLFWRI